MVHTANYRHLVPGVSVIKTLSLYEFAPKGWDLATVVRIREGPYYRGYCKRKCMRILSVLRKLSVLERCPSERLVRMERCPYGEVSVWRGVRMKGCPYGEVSVWRGGRPREVSVWRGVRIGEVSVWRGVRIREVSAWRGVRIRDVSIWRGSTVPSLKVIWVHGVLLNLTLLRQA